MRLGAFALAALALSACSQPPPQMSQPMAPPTLQFRTNPIGAPGYVSPCAGGQPQMQYNCPADHN